MSRVAAVDVGSNSVRLLVADAAPADAGRPGNGAGPLRQVDRRMRVTRLGQGVDVTGRLDDAALERTLAVIAEFVASARDLGVGRVRVVATSAVRDAGDRQRFLDAVADRVGIDAEVLSGADEAAMTFIGAVAAVDAAPPACVVDIGGGSTELIVGVTVPTASTSRQLGCVRLAERALGADPPTEAELADARDIVAVELDAVAAELDTAGATLVGVAGTVTTLAALHLGLGHYEPAAIHGARMPAAAVRRLTRWLAGMTNAERAALGPMQAGREDVIVAGALILEGILDRLGFAEVLVSEADILDGLALDLLEP